MGAYRLSAHSVSALSSIHEKDKGSVMNAGELEKWMNERYHRKEEYSNGIMIKVTEKISIGRENHLFPNKKQML